MVKCVFIGCKSRYKKSFGAGQTQQNSIFQSAKWSEYFLFVYEAFLFKKSIIILLI